MTDTYSVADYMEETGRQARAATIGSFDNDPDEAARAIELGKSSGIPDSTIYPDVEGFERAYKANLSSNLIQNNPHLADYLNSHPLAPTLSHDDLGQLDVASQHISNLFPDSRLGKWLADDSIAQSFIQAAKATVTPPKEFTDAYGPEPLGASAFRRPEDLEYAQSHPAWAALAASVATPMEFMSRATSGLIRLGHDNIEQVFGKSAADEMAAMAEWAMTRGDMPAHMDPLQQSIAGEAKVQGLPDFDKMLEHVANVAKGIELADPWTKIGREPPAGIHPLIDEAKGLQAKEDIKNLDDALSESQKSATRERSPEFYANFVRQHIGEREIGIDSGAIRALYGDKGPEAGDNLLGWVPDLDKKLAAAELTGEDIRVPVADWLAHVDPEVAKVLHDDIRVRDNGLTINETKVGEGIEEPKAKVDDLDKRLGAMADERHALNTEEYQGMPNAKVAEKDRDLHNALSTAVLPGWNHERAMEAAKWAMENSRPDIAEAIAERSQRSAEKTNLTPGVDKDSPKYAKIEADLASKKEQYLAEAAELNKVAGRDGSELHPRPEPKTTGPDIVQQIRGAAGFEPQLMAGDRFVQLKKRPSEAGVGPDQPFHDIDILDENGNAIGTINISEQKGGKELHVDMIQAGSKESKFYQPNFLGPALMRDIARQLKRMFPNALDENGRLNVTGHRVSGAREAAGKVMEMPEASVKLQVPEGWGSVEPMRDLLNHFWEPMNHAYEGLRGPKTLDEQVLDQAIRKEIERILPAKISEVQTPGSIRGIGTEKQVGGFYERLRQDFPKIAVALDGSGTGALDVARHEAIHHLRGYGFFKPEEWSTLERAARDGGWLDKHRINERYPKLDMPGKLEEAVAEQYRKWVAGERVRPEVHAIFEKLKEMFENIKTAFKEATGQELNWEEIFKKIDAGEVGSREGTEPLPVKGQGTPFNIKEMAVEEPSGSESSPGIYDRGKALGVTQSHMDRMLKLIDKRNAEDLEAANRRSELRQRRRSNREYRDRRTTLKEEVRQDLRSRPDIALDELMAKQKIKINPAYLTEDQRARLPKDYLQTKDGINPDDLAPYFGYTSGDALVERLGMLTEDRRRAGMSQRDYFNRLADVETDRRLNQEFGNREQNILDEAKDQALSETQLNLVHEETLAYALKAHGPDYVPQFTKDQVREMVRGVFNDTPIGQISSDRLLQNAGKIGKRIEEAGSKGDWATAYTLSQQRNHTVIAAKFARDYEKARSSFDRTAKTFRKREVPSIPAEYLNWIHSVLLSVERPVNRSIQDLQENIGRQGSQTLKDFKDEKEAEWMGMRELPVADNLLDPAFHKNLSDLTHFEFMGLKNTIDTLAKAGRDEKKIYREGEAYDREQTLGEMRDKLSEFGYKPTNVTPGPIAKWPRAFFYGLTNMETLLNRWDRGDPRGVFQKTIMQPLAAAANSKARLQREVASAYAKLSKPKGLDKLVDAPFPDPMTRTPQNPDGAGPWVGFNRGNVLAMLQNAGNKSNWRTLARGYGADPDALMQWLYKNTTKEDWDRAQQVGDTIFKNLIAKADNVYERMTGATIEKIPLEPINTPYGQYKGWYHPLVADADRKTVWVQDPDTGQWSQKAQGKKDTLADTDFMHFTTANGYTKKRTGAIYPLDLNFNLVPTRVKQMIHDINFKEPIHEAQKVFSDRRFQEDVSKYYGSEYTKGLMPYLRSVAGAEGIPSEGLAMASKISEYLRQNVISTYIGFNPFTVLKHGPTAAVMSSREVGPGSFFGAVKTLYAQAPSVARITHDFIMQNSEEIQRRERNWQDTIAGQGREITGAGNFREKVIEKGSAAVAWSDMVSAKPTWLAAYNKYLADGLSHGESVALAERAVRRAHGSTSETNQPPLVRGGGPLHGWLTSVYGFFGTAMQRRIETAHKLNDAWDLGKGGQINAASNKLGSAFTDFMTYMVWPTIVEEAVTGIGSDDHRTWGSRLISGATMGAASSVLYLRDLVHGAISGHEPGVGMLSSALHDVNNLVRDIGRGRDALSKQHAGKTVGDLLTVAGEATGMAPKIVGNVARYGINVARGQEKPKSVADILLGATKGTQKPREVK